MLTSSEILGPGGRIAARLPNYEHRGQQLAMAEAVDRAIRDKHHLVVEAGTGVGKSFAYLVPAILAVAGEGSRRSEEESGIPPSRGGFHAHDQPARATDAEDLPLLNSVIPLEFSAVLVKGRGNYLSLRRMENALSRAAGLFSDAEEFDAFAPAPRLVEGNGRRLAGGTRFSPSPAVWDEVASDHGNCMGRACPTYGKCFYYKARRRMQNAQILVVNHALFFTDLALRRENVSILPKYDVVILDEAHTIEAIAGDHLGLSIANGQIEYTLRKLYNDRTNRGLLVHHKLARGQEESPGLPRTRPTFFDSVARWLDEQPKGNGRVRQPNIVANSLSEGLRKLAAMLRRQAKQIDGPKNVKISPPRRTGSTSLAARHRAIGLANRLPTRSIGSSGVSAAAACESTLAAAPIDVGPDPPRASFHASCPRPL